MTMWLGMASLFYVWLKHWEERRPLLRLLCSPPLYTVWIWNFGKSTQMVWIIPQWMFIQYVMAGTRVKMSPTLQWCTSRISTWTPPFFYLQPSLGENICSHGFSYQCHADDTQLYFLSPRRTPQYWLEFLHTGWWIINFYSIFRKLSSSFSKRTRLPHKILTSSSVHLHWPQQKMHGTWVTFDDQLHFSEHVASVPRSCRFTFGPFLSILHNLLCRPWLCLN